MKRVLITGGAGFIGSHLSEYFLAKGFHVVCMDNLLTGTLENIEHLINAPGETFQFVKHDITRYINIDGPLDYILHFASPASPIDYAKHPIETLTVGSMGTRNALGLAKKKNSRFLLASTSEVYGDPLVHPQPETYFGNVDTLCVRGVYDEAKRFAEAITMAYHRTHGIDTRIARIFNTYGPRMRIYDGRVLPTFLRQALLGEPLTLFGDGSQTRSFCFVSDLVDGIYRLMMSEERLPVNLGNPEEMSVRSFADRILAFTGSKSEMINRELPESDPKVRRPDIGKAARVLDWKPCVTLEEGLEHSIGYFRTQVDRIRSGEIHG